MKINNHDVKLENGIYKYFSCTCAQEDERFWKNIVKDITGNEIGEFSNSLVYALGHCFDAVVTNICVDMWMGFSVETPKHKLYITTDHLHYGLAAACVILGRLDPKALEEYDMQNILEYSE